MNGAVANAFIFTVFCTFQLFHLIKDPSNVGMALIVFLWDAYFTAFVIAVFAVASKLTNVVSIKFKKLLLSEPNKKNEVTSLIIVQGIV